MNLVWRIETITPQATNRITVLQSCGFNEDDDIATCGSLLSEAERPLPSTTVQELDELLVVESSFLSGGVSSNDQQCLLI